MLLEGLQGDPVLSLGVAVNVTVLTFSCGPRDRISATCIGVDRGRWKGVGDPGPAPTKSLLYAYVEGEGYDPKR